MERNIKSDLIEGFGKQRDTFIFYRSFMESIDQAPEPDQLQLYRAISRYALDRTEPDNLIGMVKAVWLVIKPQLDANWNKYLNGRKGGAPQGSKNNPDGRRGKFNNAPLTNQELTLTNQELTKNKPNVNDNDNVNDNVNDNASSKDDMCVSPKRKNKKFTKPTLEEVKAYILGENIANVDPDQWFCYYESNGWRVGKNPMRDWKASVRTWSKNGFNKPTPQNQPPAYGLINDAPDDFKF